MNQLGCGGETAGEDKIANAGVSVVASGFGVPGSTFAAPLSFLHNRQLRDKVRRLPYMDVHTDKGRDLIESILISVGFDLFHSLEFQFMHVTPTKENNLERALIKLAEEATHRSINYFVESKEKRSFEAQQILTGILKGRSGKISLVNSVRYKLPILKPCGHTLIFNAIGHDKKISTNDYFKRPILAFVPCKFDGQDCTDPSDCLQASKCQFNSLQNKLFYRRPLEHECTSTYHFPFENQQRYEYQVTREDFPEVESHVKKRLITRNDDRHNLELQKKALESSRAAEAKKMTMSEKWWPKEVYLPQTYLERKNYDGSSMVDLVCKFLTQDGTTAIVAKKTTLTGMGGIGKSSMAKAYAIKYADKYEHIFWVDSEGPALKRCLLDLAATLKLKEQVSEASETKYIATRIYKCEILKGKSCLFIFDNVDEYETVKNLLPGSEDNFHTIITSRSQEWGSTGGYGKIPKLSLEVFTEAEAADFFQKVRNLHKCENENETRIFPLDDLDANRRLAQALGYLPLALNYAVATITEEKMTVQEYINELDKCDNSPLEQETALDDYERSVLKTLSISVKKIKSVNEKSGPSKKVRDAALHILNMCAYYEPENIGKTTFLNLGSILDFEGNVQSVVERAIHLLAKFSLVTLNSDVWVSVSKATDWYTFNIHRLLQTVLRLLHKNLEDYSSETWKTILNDAFKMAVWDWFEGREMDDFHGKKRHAIALWRYVKNLKKKYGPVFDSCAHFPATLSFYMSKVDESYFKENTDFLTQYFEDNELPVLQLRTGQAYYDYYTVGRESRQAARERLKHLATMNDLEDVEECVKQQIQLNYNLSLCNINEEDDTNEAVLNFWCDLFATSLEVWNQSNCVETGDECDYANFTLIKKAWEELPPFCRFIPLSQSPLNPFQVAQHAILLCSYHDETNMAPNKNLKDGQGYKLAVKVIEKCKSKTVISKMNGANKITLKMCEYHLNKRCEPDENHEKHQALLLESIFDLLSKYMVQCSSYWESYLPYSWNDQFRYYSQSITRFKKFVEEPLSLYCAITACTIKSGSYVQKGSVTKWNRVNKLVNYLMEGCSTIWGDISHTMIHNIAPSFKGCGFNEAESVQLLSLQFQKSIELHTDEMKYGLNFPTTSSLICLAICGLEYGTAIAKMEDNPNKYTDILGMKLFFVCFETI